MALTELCKVGAEKIFQKVQKILTMAKISIKLYPFTAISSKLLKIFHLQSHWYNLCNQTNHLTL